MPLACAGRCKVRSGGLGGRRAERTVAIPLVKNVKVLGLAGVIAIYAFSISFALSRYMPYGVPFALPNTKWLASRKASSMASCSGHSGL